jgi:hypothetical protein
MLTFLKIEKICHFESSNLGCFRSHVQVANHFNSSCLVVFFRRDCALSLKSVLSLICSFLLKMVFQKLWNSTFCLWTNNIFICKCVVMIRKNLHRIFIQHELDVSLTSSRLTRFNFNHWSWRAKATGHNIFKPISTFSSIKFSSLAWSHRALEIFWKLILGFFFTAFYYRAKLDWTINWHEFTIWKAPNSASYGLFSGTPPRDNWVIITTVSVWHSIYCNVQIFDCCKSRLLRQRLPLCAFPQRLHIVWNVRSYWVENMRGVTLHGVHWFTRRSDLVSTTLLLTLITLFFMWPLNCWNIPSINRFIFGGNILNALIIAWLHGARINASCVNTIKGWLFLKAYATHDDILLIAILRLDMSLLSNHVILAKTVFVQFDGVTRIIDWFSARIMLSHLYRHLLHFI